MIGIRAIGVHVPAARVDNIAQGREFGEDEAFIREKIGATQLPRLAEDLETSDLAVAALEELIRATDLVRDEIEVLIVVTQNGDGHGLPHTSAIVQHKAGLPTSVAAFDVSLGCSGYVYGLSILKGLMETMGMKNGVLITADPYSKIIDRRDRVTTLLFGDAATATWIGEGAAWHIGTPLLATDGSGAQHLFVGSDDLLAMNGRQVFNFASMTIPKQIKEYLQQASVESAEVDVFCLHQGSASIVTTISRRFPDLADRFVIEMDQVGNTVSSTIPLLLQNRINDPAITKILICGFGVGLSWATNLLTRSAINAE